MSAYDDWKLRSDRDEGPQEELKIESDNSDDYYSAIRDAYQDACDVDGFSPFVFDNAMRRYGYRIIKLEWLK